MSEAATAVLDRTRFARAAEMIREQGFWNGTENNRDRRICAGLALLEAERETGSGSYYVESDHLARQLGYTGPVDSGTLDFIYAWNDRTSEAEVLDVLDKLGRGESLV